ncbi:M14 family metallopeptidase [Spirosoma aerolatum]|uniref:M14 family metallopeptidase n=1 Tax=Spirosoma aerolatum TaxID=1211326 RepID=UPI0009AEF508|nr:M14 family metallopeptidase [Spirosoma aerolatum]
MKYLSLFFLLACTALQTAFAQQTDPDLNGMRAIGTPANPKVPWTWNYYMDFAGYTKLAQELAKKHPDLVRVESMGKSSMGRDMWVITVSDFKTGKPEQKPAFWIDGNIHANELQGTQFSMYTVWYLAENFGKVDFITQLLKDKTFYISPSLNPDAHENFMHKANTTSSSRSGMIPLDDDGDGTADEDDVDDLDGDGNIVQMRRKSPTGRWKVDPSNPVRMIQAAPDEPGEYELLGNEGIDNDGDGRVNEDTPGSYDPNRDWGWNWQPDYVQNGAFYFPGTLAETQNVKKFFYSHPNIAGAQSYHNFGGMFLRPPGAEEDQMYVPQADIAVYDLIGKTGEKMIPGYKYYVLWKDLYTVYGGEIDFIGLNRGIFMFSNEINNSYRLFNKNSTADRFSNTEFEEFDKLLLLGDAYVKWKPIKHPQYGDIEIGGVKRNYVRNTPGFMLEEEGHRNMAFTLLHTFHTPKLEIMDIKSRELPGGYSEVTATVMNHRAIPTHSAQDLRFKIERPDYITLKNAQVVAGMIVENADLGLTREQKRNPQTIEVANIGGTVSGGGGNGFGGFGGGGNSVRVRWIVKGKADKYTVEVDSRKGGVVTKTM